MFLLLTFNSKGHLNVLPLLFSIHLVPVKSRQKKKGGNALLSGG